MLNMFSEHKTMRIKFKTIRASKLFSTSSQLYFTVKYIQTKFIITRYFPRALTTRNDATSTKYEVSDLDTFGFWSKT